MDGARRPLPLRGVLGAVEAPNEGFGKLGSAGREVFGGEMLPVLLRVLATGKAGRAMFGGPLDGLEGRGRAVDMAGERLGRESTSVRIQTGSGVEVSGQLCTNWQAEKLCAQITRAMNGMQAEAVQRLECSSSTPSDSSLSWRYRRDEAMQARKQRAPRNGLIGRLNCSILRDRAAERLKLLHST